MKAPLLNPEREVIIGSRGSDLALWQARHVQAQLADQGMSSTIQVIQTQGDQIQHLSFDKLEGKGFFTKEIEQALLTKSIDLAVHSHKDLETTQPAGLAIAAVSSREDPRELLLVRKERVGDDPKFPVRVKGVVGTSSARRKAQVLFYRPDVQLKDIRGNVPTRIQKLRDGHFDAIMLAKAGVSRLELDLSDLYVVELDTDYFIPAPAQGVLALQVRADDRALHEAIRVLSDQQVEQTTRIEREVLRLFQGGCQLPLGVYCEQNGNGFSVWAAMAETWDAPVKRVYLESADSASLPQQVVTQLKKKVSEPSA